MISTRRAFLLGAAGAVGTALVGCERSQRPQSPPELPKPPLLGAATAPKRFVFWGSYTCPYTAQLFGILNGIVASMPNTVSVEWHHFPTHPPDPALHVAGLGFKGAHFWGFTSRVLGEVLRAFGDYSGLTPQKLAEFAQAEGGSKETLTAAYADKAKWEAVKGDLLAGRLLGVTQTPGLFYNGYFMTPNGVPLDLASFDKSLRAMLQQG